MPTAGALPCTGLSRLYTLDYRLENIVAMRQSWAHGSRFSMSLPRPTDALLLFSDSAAVCVYPDGETRSFVKGTLVHLPRGARYTWQFGNEGSGETLLFEFIPYLPDGNIVDIAKEPNVYAVDTSHAAAYEKEFRLLIDETRRPLPCPGIVRAAAYRVLSGTARNDYRGRYSYESLPYETRIIAKGIGYLEDDPEQALPIAEIAEMCHVSVNHFEKLFKRYAGVTPSAFRLERKLSKARQLLENGGMTLSQIAEELNFCDTAYLCRLFRKRFGVSPSKYRSDGKTAPTANDRAENTDI